MYVVRPPKCLAAWWGCIEGRGGFPRKGQGDPPPARKTPPLRRGSRGLPRLPGHNSSPPYRFVAIEVCMWVILMVLVKTAASAEA